MGIQAFFPAAKIANGSPAAMLEALWCSAI
jgi:hypothetical protein